MQKPLSRFSRFRQNFLLAFALAFMYAATPARGAPVNFAWVIDYELLSAIDGTVDSWLLQSSTVTFYIMPSLSEGYVESFASDLDGYFQINPKDNGYIEDYLATELVVPYSQVTIDWDNIADYINNPWEFELKNSFNLDDTEIDINDVNVFVFFVIQVNDWNGDILKNYGPDARDVIMGYSPSVSDMPHFGLEPGTAPDYSIPVGNNNIYWPEGVKGGIMYFKPVPEPSTGVMALAGLALLLKRRRK